MSETKSRSRLLRHARKVHRITAAWLFVFFFIMALSGLLLGLKKHSGGIIQAKNHQGSSADLSSWLPLDILHQKACSIYRDAVSPTASLDLERIDVRKEKGMVKFIFREGFRAIQLDGATGQLLHVEIRSSDFIEKIHDGSIVDYYLGTRNDPFKVFYSTTMGLALIMFTITGFWLWQGRNKNKN